MAVVIFTLLGSSIPPFITVPLLSSLFLSFFKTGFVQNIFATQIAYGFKLPK